MKTSVEHFTCRLPCKYGSELHERIAIGVEGTVEYSCVGKVKTLLTFCPGDPETCNDSGLFNGLSSKNGVEGERDNGDSNTGEGGLPVDSGDNGVFKLWLLSKGIRFSSALWMK